MKNAHNQQHFPTTSRGRLQPEGVARPEAEDEALIIQATTIPTGHQDRPAPPRRLLNIAIEDVPSGVGVRQTTRCLPRTPARTPALQERRTCAECDTSSSPVSSSAHAAPKDKARGQQRGAQP